VEEEKVLSKPAATFEAAVLSKATLKSKIILATWLMILLFLLSQIFVGALKRPESWNPVLSEFRNPPNALDSISDTLIAPRFDSSVRFKQLLQIYQQAYPDFIQKVSKNALHWRDSTQMVFDDGIADKSFEALLNVPDLEDQIAQPYTLGKAYKIVKNHDPGRIRYEPFFKKMYGASKEAVEKNLVTIRWLPKTLNVALRVTRINEIDKKLQKISDELEKRTHLTQYLKNPGGTFQWRNIAGTHRLSTHSFGSTIDINVAYSHYWKWDFDKYGIFKYQNSIPLEIVELFEKYGFIWGGKWYHYDTMHFEYRPELILCERSNY
jgi:peptidoglycan LD-endopeptidase CwlK